MFYHPGKDSRAGVYRDGFMILGAEHHSDSFKAQISEAYEMALKHVWDPTMGTLRLLNRPVEWKHDGIYHGSRCAAC